MKCYARSCTLKRVVIVCWNVHDILIKFLLSITFDMSSCWYKLLTAVAVCIVSVALTSDLQWDLHQYHVALPGKKWSGEQSQISRAYCKKRVRIDQ